MYELHEVRYQDIDISEYPYRFIIHDDFPERQSRLLAETTKIREEELKYIPPFRPPQ
jgi:hypothetical protein